MSSLTLEEEKTIKPSRRQHLCPKQSAQREYRPNSLQQTSQTGGLKLTALHNAVAIDGRQTSRVTWKRNHVEYSVSTITATIQHNKIRKAV